MKNKIGKKIISVILTIAIIINVIPNFTQLSTVYASDNVSSEKNLIIKKVNYDADNKVIALEAWIRNINFVSFDLTFSYPSEILTPLQYSMYEMFKDMNMGSMISMPTINAADITTATKMNTDLPLLLDTNNASELKTADGTIRTYVSEKNLNNIDIRDDEKKIYTIYFRIEGDNSIDSITSDMFQLIYKEDVADPSQNGFNIVEHGTTENIPIYDISVFGFEGFPDQAEKPQVSGLEISGIADSYFVGDTLNIDSITVKKKYSDGTSDDTGVTLGSILNDSNYTVKINETTLTADTTLNSRDVLTVAYNGEDKAEGYEDATVTLNVTEPQLTSMRIDGVADTYKEGTEINLTNLSVLAKFERSTDEVLLDDSKYTLTAVTASGTSVNIVGNKINPTTAEDITITATYNDDETKTATKTITVVNKELTGLTATKTTWLYKQGEILDLSDLTVTAKWDTTPETELGDTIPLKTATTDGYTIEGAADGDTLNTVGVKEITVKYGNKTATVELVVFPNKLKGTEREALSTVTIPENTVGFTWENVNSTLNAGVNNANLQFVDKDGTTQKLSIEVLGLPADLTATYGDKLSDVTLPDGFSWPEEIKGNSVENVTEDGNEFAINYAGYTDLKVKIIVDPKEIMVKIGNESSKYGEDIKTLKASNLVTLKDGSELVPTDDIDGLGISLIRTKTDETTATTEINVGTYAIRGNATNTNYEVKFENGTYTITKGTLVADNFDKTIPANKEYDGNPITAASANIKSTVSGAGEVTVKYYKDGESTGTTVAPSAYGTYTVKAYVAEGDNYFAADGTEGKPEIGLGSFSITKKQLTKPDIDFTAPTPNIYDGTEKPATVAIKSSVVGAGTISTIKYYKGGIETNPIDAGTYTVKITTTGATNYDNVTDMEVGTFTIEKAEPTYTLPTGLTATYGDELSSITLPPEFTWEDSGKVGDAGTQTHKAKYTPTDKNNYKEKTGIDVDIEVGKANLQPEDFELSGMPTNNTKEYDGDSVTVTSKIENTVPGADDIRNKVTVTYYKKEDETESAEAPSDYGTYEVRVSVEEGNNYNAVNGLKIKEFSITEATLDIGEITVEDPTPNVYDGTPKIPTIKLPVGAGTVKDIKYYKDGTTTEVSNPIDAGLYRVEITTENATNYADITTFTAVGTFEIAKADIPVNHIIVTPDAEKTYNGKPSKATATLDGTVPGADDVTIDVTYVDADGNPVTDPTDAGTYKIKVSSTGGKNYKSLPETETTETIVINKVTLSKDDIQCTLPGSLVYDNTSKKATITVVKDLGEGKTLTVDATDIIVKYEDEEGNIVADPKNAGAYTIKVSVSAGKNYEGLRDTEVTTYEIEKATLTAADFTVTGMPTGGSKEHDGIAVTVTAPQKAHITETLNTEVQYYSSDNPNNAMVFDDDVKGPSGVGTYTVKLKVDEGTNYKAADIDLGTFTITPKGFDASKIKYTNTAEYDGTNKDENTVNIYIDGDNGATIANVTFKQDGTLVDARNVGTYKVYADITTTESGHVGVIEIGTFEITKKAITVTIQDETIEYGEDLTAIRVNDDVVLGSGDNIGDIITYELSAKTAGTQTIIGKVKDTDTAKNYNVTFVNGNCTIEPKEITITIGNTSSKYTGAEPTMPSTSELISDPTADLVNGDTVSSLGITLSKAPGTDVGDYEITGNATNTNYEVNFVDGTYTITKATLTESDFNRDIKDVTFGTTVTINPTYKNGITEADAGEITVKYYAEGDTEGTEEIPTAVGTYEVKVNVPGGKNYYPADGSTDEKGNVFAEIKLGEFSINRSTEQPNITATGPVNNTYDGNEKEATLNDDIPDGVGDVTITYYKVDEEGNETPLGENEKPKDAGKYVVKAETTGGESYDAMAETKVGEFEILPREIEVTIDDKTSVYGNTLETLTSNVTDGELVEDDDLGITLSKADGTDVNTYAITGEASNKNYKVTFIDGTYTITARAVTISIDNKESAIKDELEELTYNVTVGTKIGTDKVVELETNADKDEVGTYDITVKSTNDNYDVTIANTNEKAIYTVKDKVKEITLSKNEITADCGTSIDDLIKDITYTVVYVGAGEQTAETLDITMMGGGYKPNITSSQTLKVRYTDEDINSATYGQEFTTDLTVTLSDALQSITVTTTDKNVNYYEGQTFNKEDMVVTANYAKAASRSVDNYEIYVIRNGAEVKITDTTTLEKTDEEIIIKYTEDGTTVSSEKIAIDVKEDEIVNVTFNFNGTTTYDYGDAIDLGTSTVTKVWASGFTHDTDTIPMKKDMLSIKEQPTFDFDSMNKVGTHTVTVTVDGIESKDTFTITVEDIVTGIQIQNKENLQKEYDLNGSLNYNYKDTTNPVKVTVTYASSGTEEVNLAECYLSGYDLTDKTKIGQTQTVKVTYEGKEDSFEIKVRDYVESIKVTKYKAIYDIGESLNIQEVKAIMASGEENIITGYIANGFSSTTPGTVKVTVTYGDKKDEIAVTIRNKVDDMYIEKLPSQISSDGTSVDKTIPFGTDLVKTNGTIIVKDAVNPEGKEISMTDPSVSLEGYNKNQVGTQTITVRYTYEEITDDGETVTQSKTATFNVEVEDYETGYQITPPTKTTYEYGEDLNLAGATVSVKWASGKTTDTTDISGEMISSYNSKQVGAQTITVSAFGKDNVGSFTVNVVDSTIGISMKEYPSKTEYTQGQAIDVTGAILNVTKSSGTKEIAVTKEMISGYNPNKTGTQIITVTYDGKQTTFPITVNPRPNQPSNPKPSRPTTPTNPTTPEVVKYTVKFVDYDGTVLKEEVVESGKSAVAPELEKRDGYKFKGWDKLFDDVKEDVTVKAQYEKIERAKVNGTVTVEQGEEPDLSDVTIEIFDEDGEKLDEIPVTEDMISGFDSDKIGTQIVTVTYVGEDGYEYTDTLKIRVVRPTETLGVKDEFVETKAENMPFLPVVAGIGGAAGLLLILLALASKKNVEIYALTENGRKLVGKQKISKNNPRIVLDEYERELQNANIEIVLKKNITKKLDDEIVSVVLDGKRSTYRVQYKNNEEFIIRIKNAD